MNNSLSCEMIHIYHVGELVVLQLVGMVLAVMHFDLFIFSEENCLASDLFTFGVSFVVF